MQNSGSGGVLHSIFVIRHGRYDSLDYRWVSTPRQRIQRRRSNQMILVLGRGSNHSVLDRGVVIFDQDLSGSGTDRRAVILHDGPVGGVSHARERDEANALLNTEERHLFRIPESVKLLRHQTLAGPPLAGEDLVINLVSQCVFHDEQRVGGGKRNQGFLVRKRLL